MAQTATASVSMIAVPEIKIYGAGDLGRLVPFDFEGQIGTEIIEFGAPYPNLHKGSIALGDQAALFQLYLLSELGEVQLPEDVTKVFYKLFEEVRYGNITDDACDYDHCDRSLKKLKKNDIPVLWTVHPDRFEKTDTGWKAIVGEDSEQFPSHLPKSGYVELTVDGAYCPVNSPSRPKGIPFSTVGTRAEAENSWILKGYDKKFAKKAVSSFKIQGEQGTAFVHRCCCHGVEDGLDGSFGVSVIATATSGDYVFGAQCVGLFPASRLSTERSGAAPEDMGIKVLPLKEYDALVADSKKLKQTTEVIKALFKELL